MYGLKLVRAMGAGMFLVCFAGFGLFALQGNLEYALFVGLGGAIGAALVFGVTAELGSDR